MPRSLADLRRPLIPRQTHAEDGLVVLRANGDLAAVGAYDLLDDPKTKAEAARSLRVGTLPKWLEQLGERPRRDLAQVDDRQDNVLTLPVDLHLHLSFGRTMRERVPDQVGDDLSEAAGVPPTAQLARGGDHDVPPGTSPVYLCDRPEETPTPDRQARVVMDPSASPPTKPFTEH